MAAKKQCFKCLRVLSRADFYAHPQMADGLLGKCKRCTKKDAAERYALHRDRILARDNELHALAMKTDAEYVAARKRWAARALAAHPGKARARYTAQNAVKNGRLRRSPCESCGEKIAQAHHDDYRRPMAVRWLCFPCHAAVHGKQSRIKDPNRESTEKRRSYSAARRGNQSSPF